MISAIHTKKRFGFTFAGFGLITMSSFVKYLLIYGNLMMKIYKFHRKPAFIKD